MCAINGSSGSHEAVVARMNARTGYRGPDGTAVWTNGKVTLGFNRLAIIDLSERSMQPMHRKGSYSLVFNGEIYNFKELKKELSGFQFESDGDAEVIIAAYEKWGTEAFSRLNGMFALALYDHEQNALILARDPVGVKPLYYAVHEQELWFSSDATALLEVVPRKLNHEAFALYLQLLYTPGPLTFIQDVRRVLPGEILTFSNGALSHSAIAEQRRQTDGGFKDAVEAVRSTVTSAIERQLVSDRPVGLFLSGGVDSSIVASVASRAHPKINTYSVRFALENANENEKFNSDADRARESAKEFGTTHHEFEVSADDAAEHFEEMIERMHQPVANATALAQLYLSKKTKETATVVLTGDGGDELFGGYERYRMALLAEHLSRIVPERVATHLPHPWSALHLRGVRRYLQLMEQKVRVTTAADSSKFFSEHFRNGDGVRALMYADERTWLVDEALVRTDAMTMAASVEARVPLLDLEVRALAHSLPRKFLVTPWKTKRVLREAFSDILPRAVTGGPKRGWYSPGSKWLRTPAFLARSEHYFTNPAYAELVDTKELKRLHTEHLEKKAYHFPLLWAVLTALAWVEQHKLTL